jgi:membrane protease YdiL (CAAX protease family)
MSTQTTNRIKAGPILWFLLIVFAATWSVEYSLIKSGIRFDTEHSMYTPTLWLLATMWIPGLAALLVTGFTEGAAPRRLAAALSLRPGQAGPYFLCALLIPMVFAVIYAISWGAGFATPDWTLHALTQASDDPQSVNATSLFTVMLPASMLLGPAIQFVFALGEELGWRGFLLPRLMMLGKLRAYLILGLAWGLWHAPLILVGFNYPGHPIAGIAMMCMVTTAFGLFINEMFLHYRSVLLAAFIHAAVNAQAQGIWMWLFQDTDPLLGGGFGLTGAVVWLAVGAFCFRTLSRSRNGRPPF